jgi:hypothetical protein
MHLQQRFDKQNKCYLLKAVAISHRNPPRSVKLTFRERNDKLGANVKEPLRLFLRGFFFDLPGLCIYIRQVDMGAYVVAHVFNYRLVFLAVYWRIPTHY